MAKAPVKLTEKLEKEWDADLFYPKKGLATLLGWASYHTLRSRGSAPGFPDRTIWKDRHLFAELKRELTGAKSEDKSRRPSPRQVEILDGLARAGAEVYLWRPSDLQEIATILGRPWRFVAAAEALDQDFGSARAELRIGSTSWTPGSLWVCGEGRADGSP